MKTRNCVAVALMCTAVLLGAIDTPAQNKTGPTAREIVAEIQKQVGVPWQTVVSGLPALKVSTVSVTGIAVTMMATMDVLQRASAQGLNFVITHERTWMFPKACRKAIQFGLRSAPLSKNTIWWFGGFTTTGTCASRMVSKPARYMH